MKDMFLRYLNLIFCDVYYISILPIVLSLQIKQAPGPDDDLHNLFTIPVLICACSILKHKSILIIPPNSLDTKPETPRFAVDEEKKGYQPAGNR